MKKNVSLFCILLVCLLAVTSCVTSISDFNKVTRGMSQIQVYNLLGRPTSTGVDENGNEYFVYNNVSIDPWSNLSGDFKITFDGSGLVSQYGQINSYQSQPSFVYVKEVEKK